MTNIHLATWFFLNSVILELGILTDLRKQQMPLLAAQIRDLVFWGPFKGCGMEGQVANTIFLSLIHRGWNLQQRSLFLVWPFPEECCRYVLYGWPWELQAGDWDGTGWLGHLKAGGREALLSSNAVYLLLKVKKKHLPSMARHSIAGCDDVGITHITLCVYLPASHFSGCHQTSLLGFLGVLLCLHPLGWICTDY